LSPANTGAKRVIENSFTLLSGSKVCGHGENVNQNVNKLRNLKAYVNVPPGEQQGH